MDVTMFVKCIPLKCLELLFVVSLQIIIIYYFMALNKSLCNIYQPNLKITMKQSRE